MLLIALIPTLVTADERDVASSSVFGRPRVVARFGPNDPSRYFGLVAWRNRYLLYARSGHYPHADPNPRTSVWRGCDASLLTRTGEPCVEGIQGTDARWPVSFAHNAAFWVEDREIYAVGGQWGPGKEKRGLEKRGPARSFAGLAATPSSTIFRGDHPGCVDRRPKQRGTCEFDGRVAGPGGDDPSKMHACLRGCSPGGRAAGPAKFEYTDPSPRRSRSLL